MRVRWITQLFDPKAEGGGGTGGNSDPGNGKDQPGDSGKPDAGKSQPGGDDPPEDPKNELVREKIALRKRAQAAEDALATTQGELENTLKSLDELKTKVSGFELATKRSELLDSALEKAAAEGKGVENLKTVKKYVDKLTNPETLEADIADTLKDFLVDAKKINPVAGGGTPAKPGSDQVEVDLNNPFAMMKLREKDPEAYKAAVAAAQAKTKPGAPTFTLLGIPK